MSQHVFSWLTGFGWTVIPQAPFQFEQLPGQPRSVLVRHFAPNGVCQVTLTVLPDGSAVDWKLAPDTADLHDVLTELSETATDVYDHWRVEAGFFSIRWPAGFLFASVPSLTPPVFELIGPDRSLIYLQGPIAEERCPPVEGMVAPGQTPVGSGRWDAGPFIELEYVHEGQAWRQLHCPLQRLRGTGQSMLVSAQSLACHSELLKAAAKEVADSFTLYPG